MKKVAVIGSRNFTDYDLMKIELDKIIAPFIIVSGAARGADTLAERYADEMGYNKIIFPAEWKKYGKSAGYKRNRLIIENSDLVVAFWDGYSEGTRHSINIAKCMKKPHRIFLYSQNDNLEQFLL